MMRSKKHLRPGHAFGGGTPIRLRSSGAMTRVGTCRSEGHLREGLDRRFERVRRCALVKHRNCKQRSGVKRARVYFGMLANACLNLVTLASFLSVPSGCAKTESNALKTWTFLVF